MRGVEAGVAVQLDAHAVVREIGEVGQRVAVGGTRVGSGRRLLRVLLGARGPGGAEEGGCIHRCMHCPLRGRGTTPIPTLPVTPFLARELTPVGVALVAQVRRAGAVGGVRPVTARDFSQRHAFLLLLLRIDGGAAGRLVRCADGVGERRVGCLLGVAARGRLLPEQRRE
ncbi:hypothetical protein STCU_11132 [Strigomonas culicis]|uniref:Uncharacterized protein n=1 Tax=Strigomonas culicis TaxID=28005 RepID=S9UPM3_9TRYP|nr:hypothetical protein STCU_11132 [Strigomonas culicis]|eukprot:EPY16576.1 hypothetical protein STCU_11132 [Strigomonas culicis]